jgi:serine/threonine-protein kinase
MGTVWRAVDQELGATVAVKVLDRETARNEVTLARFKREVKAAALLRSPHVVQVLDHGVDGDVPYLVMELLEGESLADRLSRDGGLDPPEAATIITHIARAMTKAHDAGIVHRDLKPANVFLVQNDDEIIAKVLDFGIAKATITEAATDLHTQTGALLGTPHYMSPEQAAGNRAVDFRTDIWALSVIGFECLTGLLPFHESTIGALVLAICTGPTPVPSKLGPVPDGIDAWFARGVAREPSERFRSVRELAAEFRRLCDPAGAARASAEAVQTGKHARAALESAPTFDLASTSTDLASAKLSAPAKTLPSRSAFGRATVIGGFAVIGVVAIAVVAASRRPDPRASTVTSEPPVPSIAPAISVLLPPAETPSTATSASTSPSVPAPVASAAPKLVKRASSAAVSAPAPTTSAAPSAAPAASRRHNLGI